MLELGNFSRQCHQDVGRCALEHVDEIFCLGNETLAIKECWNAAGKPVTWSLDRQELAKKIFQSVKPGDVVLLKGSRSKGMWKILEEFDEIAKEKL